MGVPDDPTNPGQKTHLNKCATNTRRTLFMPHRKKLLSPGTWIILSHNPELKQEKAAKHHKERGCLKFIYTVFCKRANRHLAMWIKNAFYFRGFHIFLWFWGVRQWNFTRLPGGIYTHTRDDAGCEHIAAQLAGDHFNRHTDLYLLAAQVGWIGQLLPGLRPVEGTGFRYRFLGTQAERTGRLAGGQCQWYQYDLLRLLIRHPFGFRLAAYTFCYGLLLCFPFSGSYNAST